MLIPRLGLATTTMCIEYYNICERGTRCVCHKAIHEAPVDRRSTRQRVPNGIAKCYKAASKAHCAELTQRDLSWGHLSQTCTHCTGAQALCPLEIAWDIQRTQQVPVRVDIRDDLGAGRSTHSPAPPIRGYIAADAATSNLPANVVGSTRPQPQVVRVPRQIM